MNTSRKLLKVDKNIQRVMLVGQLMLGITGFVLGIGAYAFWAPVITLFLGIYQWGISGYIHITESKYTAEPIKKWRLRHMVGSAVYLLIAIIIVTQYRTFSAFFIFLVVIPQLIAYAYYFLTVWDERLFNKYRDNVSY
ncbi:hypothetical protein BKI52_07900 [marine bacterium AO1-C]|nr:hypothetical protein BKI52_07900 [marine bacterium AO1-C]